MANIFCLLHVRSKYEVIKTKGKKNNNKLLIKCKQNKIFAKNNRLG